MTTHLTDITRKLSQCQICANQLPLAPKPIFQITRNAKILIIGQAPGIKTHHQGRPFDDKSGQRLRDWLGLNEADFYDENLLAIMPMAFCYPGKVKCGSGDKAPPAICSRTWHKPLLEHMTHIKLTLIIGNYAAKAYGNWAPTDNLTDKIKSNREGNNTFVLPHPSPRNNIWLSKNAWFETKTLPMVRQRIQDILNK